MRVLVLLCMVLAVALAAPKDKNINKYENIDIDAILASDRILNNYIKCLLDEGPCTSEGRDLKKALPEVLAKGCVSGCDKTHPHAKSVEKVLKHLTTKRPRDWDRLAKKFDPQGVYKKKYEEQYKKEFQDKY